MTGIWVEWEWNLFSTLRLSFYFVLSILVSFFPQLFLLHSLFWTLQNLSSFSLSYLHPICFPFPSPIIPHSSLFLSIILICVFFFLFSYFLFSSFFFSLYDPIPFPSFPIPFSFYFYFHFLLFPFIIPLLSFPFLYSYSLLLLFFIFFLSPFLCFLIIFPYFPAFSHLFYAFFPHFSLIFSPFFVPGLRVSSPGAGLRVCTQQRLARPVFWGAPSASWRSRNLLQTVIC